MFSNKILTVDIYYTPGNIYELLYQELLILQDDRHLTAPTELDTKRLCTNELFLTMWACPERPYTFTVNNLSFAL